MEHKNIHHVSRVSRVTQDARGQIITTNKTFESGSSNHESHDIFRDAFEKMQFPSSSTSDMYSQMLRRREELQRKSTASHVGLFTSNFNEFGDQGFMHSVSEGSDWKSAQLIPGAVSQVSKIPPAHVSLFTSNFNEFGDQGFIHSVSEGSDWKNAQLIPGAVSQVSKIPPAQCAPSFSHNRQVFPRFGSFGGFPKFDPTDMSTSIQEDKHANGFWSFNDNSKMSTCTTGYRMQMSSSYSWSNHTMNQESGQELELYADSECDSDDEEIFGFKQITEAPSEDDTSSLGTLDQDSRSAVLAIEGVPQVDFRKDRAWRLANELLTTEESYVKVLHLIDQIFHFRVDQENRVHSMFPQEMIPQIFSNIKSIYKFHSEFLLPQLKARMVNWENDPRIGDIMKNFAPFLKMYTEYVNNFDNSMNIINACGTKNRRFADIMNEIHKMEESRGLTLSHHMISPIQRIPRYEMLLKDYLKRLTEESKDREDTAKALHLVSTAAIHANEMMKKTDKFKHLLELQENISGVVDLVSPTRELLKEGKMIKISARSGDHQERQLYLFSDYLFLCSPRPNRVISGPAYRLRAKFTLDNMQWCEGDNLETTNTFYIRDDSKNVELYTQTTEEKTSWRDALLQAIQELYKRKSSLKIGSDVEMELGKKPPNLIKMDAVTKCMECRSGFSVMKRKHHCHACGLVFCSKCSGQKYPLFERGKPSRVCKNCHQLLSTPPTVPSPDKSPDSDSEHSSNDNSVNVAFNRDKGVLDVSSNAPCVHSGFLQLKTQGKSWETRWFSLHPDFVLYSFLSNNEQHAMTATPVPGFTIAKVTNMKGESGNDKEKTFKMYHSKKTYYFQAASKEDVDRWVHALQKSSQAQIPTPS